MAYYVDSATCLTLFEILFEQTTFEAFFFEILKTFASRTTSSACGFYNKKSHLLFADVTFVWQMVPGNLVLLWRGKCLIRIRTCYGYNSFFTITRICRRSNQKTWQMISDFVNSWPPHAIFQPERENVTPVSLPVKKVVQVWVWARRMCLFSFEKCPLIIRCHWCIYSRWNY